MADGTVQLLKDVELPMIERNKFSTTQRVLMQTQRGPRLVHPYPLHDKSKRLIALTSELGGADNHHGLIIGYPTAEAACWPVRQRWEETVYWYDENPFADCSWHRR